jgi:uncharacterized protein YycO
MKKLLVVFIICFALVVTAVAYRQLQGSTFSQSITQVIQPGDLVFQTSKSSQSQAIQRATKSKYSHCGLLFQQNNAWYVFEAIEPVQATPLNTWIERGERNHFVVKRLINAEQQLSTEARSKMKTEAKKFLGKPYDLTFGWGDNTIYCSELIWKVYQRGCGIELSAMEKLGDFDFSDPTVQAKMRERYGETLPLNEPVVSPAALFNSPLLYTVTSN